jgi:hypothetical protein
VGWFKRDFQHLMQLGLFPPAPEKGLAGQSNPQYLVDTVQPVVDMLGSIPSSALSSLQVNGAAGATPVDAANSPGSTMPDSNSIWAIQHLLLQHDDPVARLCRFGLMDPAGTRWWISGDVSVAQNVYLSFGRALWLPPGWRLTWNATGLAAGQILHGFALFNNLPIGEIVFPPGC